MRIKCLKMVLAAAVGGVIAISAQASLVPVFDYSTTPPGNQPGGPYLLGLSFTVSSPVNVTALGAFDSGGLGFTGNSVEVAIYQYGGTPPAAELNGTPLATPPGNTLTEVTPIVTFGGMTGTLPNQNNSEWSSITTTTLSPGNYVVMASDYSQYTLAGNDDYNTGSSGSPTSPVGFNTLDNAMSLIPVGIWTRGTTLTTGYSIVNDNSGNSGFGFDPELNGPYGPHPYPTYAAGTFAVSAVPESTTMIAGALLLLPFGASTLRILRGKRVG